MTKEFEDLSAELLGTCSSVVLPPQCEEACQEWSILLLLLWKIFVIHSRGFSPRYPLPILPPFAVYKIRQAVTWSKTLQASVSSFCFWGSDASGGHPSAASQLQDPVWMRSTLSSIEVNGGDLHLDVRALRVPLCVFSWQDLTGRSVQCSCGNKLIDGKAVLLRECCGDLWYDTWIRWLRVGTMMTMPERWGEENVASVSVTAHFRIWESRISH